MKFIVIGWNYDDCGDLEDSWNVVSTFATNSNLSEEDWKKTLICDKVKIYTYSEATATVEYKLELS